MKKSELKEYIKEIILAELTVTSDKDTAKKLTDQGLSVTFNPKANPVSESEDEEPTQDDIKKGTKTINSPIHAKGISPEEKEKFEKTKKLINILIGKLEEYKKDKEFENWIKKSSYASELLNTRGKAKEWIKKNIGVYTKLGADKPTIPA
jgi:hypothetical protein